MPPRTAKNKAGKPKKGKGKSGGKKEPTLEGLTAHVEKIREWVMVLKDLHGLGAWRYSRYEKFRGRPNSSGGPGKYP